MTSRIPLERSKALAFWYGFFVSFLAGTLTSGVCAAYLFVLSLSLRLTSFLSSGWHILNYGGFVLFLTALLHGAIFLGIVLCANWLLARTKQDGKRSATIAIFLIYLLYAFFLLIAFPYTRDAI